MIPVIHPDFERLLNKKAPSFIQLYIDLRSYILEQFPNTTEILYYTHALSSVYSVSDKLGDSYCMINSYTNHMNLGFNKGTLLDDPNQLLEGTGKLIRHLPVYAPNDYRNDAVKKLLNQAYNNELNDLPSKGKIIAKTISKIKF